MRRVLALLLLSSFTSLVNASCMETIEDNRASFQIKQIEGDIAVVLEAKFPKVLNNNWPIDAVSFSYSKEEGRHIVRSNLAYTDEGSLYKTEVEFNPEHIGSITLRVYYQDPSSECSKYYMFSRRP